MECPNPGGRRRRQSGTEGKKFCVHYEMQKAQFCSLLFPPPPSLVSFFQELSDKRRQERNNREQKRSKRISDQIKELKTLLEVSGVQTAKGNKSSVLTCAAEYIEDLQRRNQMLARGDGVNGHGMDGGGGLKKVSEGEGEGGDKDNMDDVDGANPNRVDYQRVFYDQSVPMAITSVRIFMLLFLPGSGSFLLWLTFLLLRSHFQFPNGNRWMADLWTATGASSVSAVTKRRTWCA